LGLFLEPRELAQALQALNEALSRGGRPLGAALRRRESALRQSLRKRPVTPRLVEQLLGLLVDHERVVVGPLLPGGGARLRQLLAGAVAAPAAQLNASGFRRRQALSGSLGNQPPLFPRHRSSNVPHTWYKVSSHI